MPVSTKAMLAHSNSPFFTPQSSSSCCKVYVTLCDLLYGFSHAYMMHHVGAAFVSFPLYIGGGVVVMV